MHYVSTKDRDIMSTMIVKESWARAYHFDKKYFTISGIHNFTVPLYERQKDKQTLTA